MSVRISKVVLVGLVESLVAIGCGSNGAAPRGQIPPDGGAGDDGSTGIDGGSSAPIGIFEMRACPFSVAAGAPVTCGFVSVPENHSKPDDRKVRLAIAIVKAASPSAAPPLVYLAGGPGGSGIGSGIEEGALSEAFQPFASGRDLIFVDQRGTGASEPSLACPGMTSMMPAPPAGTMMMAGSLTPSERATLIACRARLVALGIDLAQYDTSSSADDLELVRKALGIARWDLLGVSYGTRLALEAMRRQSAGLRAVVLDSVLPTQVDAIAENPTGVYRSLDLLFKRCEAGGCGPGDLTLRSTFLETVAELARSPVPLPAGGKTFTAETFVKLVTFLLYDREGHDQVSPVLAVVRARRADALQRLADLVTDVDESISTGLHLSVMCREYLPFTTRAKAAAELAKIPAELRPYLTSESYFESCEIWNVPPAPDAVRAAVTSGVPALVLAGGLDPATPPAWSKTASRSLTAATYIEVAEAAHGVLGSACGADLINQFLAKPGPGPLPASCQ